MPRFKGIPIDDEQSETGTGSRFGGVPVSETVSRETAPEQTQYEKHGALASIFPATSKVRLEGKNDRLGRAIATAGDVLSLPARGIAGFASGLGYLYGGGDPREAEREALAQMSRTKSERKGLVGIGQDIALDPTSSPMLLGLGTAAKGGKAATTLGKALLKTALSGAASGAGSAAYQSVAGEGEIDPGRVATQAAIGAGTGAAMTGLGAVAKKATGKFLKGAAEKNIDITLRPGQTGRKAGYTHDAVVKYDLGGTPRETFEKATAKLSELQEAAQAIAKESDATFNIGEAFNNTLTQMKRTLSPEDYDKQVQLLFSLYDDYSTAFGDVVDAPTAMNIRTRIGEKTAFVGRSQGGMKIDPDADWKEKVYNKLYDEFKNMLHDNLGGELKAINKAQSEIIPVKIVAERRIPIYESNQRIGLSDLLTTRVGQGLGGAAIGGGVGYGTGGDLEGAAKGALLGAGFAGTRKYLGGPQATKAMYKLGNYLLR